MSRIVAAVFVLLALALPGFAVGAPCKYYNDIYKTREVRGPFQYIVDFGNLATIDTSIAVGQTLKRLSVSTGSILDADGNPMDTALLSCDPDLIQNVYFTNDVGPATAIPTVYQTDIPGIGLRITINGYVFPYVRYFAAGGVYTYPNYVMQLDLVKTGPIGAGGTLEGRFGTESIGRENQVYAGFYIKQPIVLVPSNPTCTVSTPDVQVALDPDDVASYTSVNMTRGEKDFKVSLACSGGDPGTSTPVYLSLADQTLPANTTQALTLTSASTASGVGIQILRNGAPISLDPALNKFKVQDVLPGNSTIDIPFKARYVRTGTMGAGTVEAIAVFTMDYQ